MLPYPMAKFGLVTNMEIDEESSLHLLCLLSGMLDIG